MKKKIIIAGASVALIAIISVSLYAYHIYSVVEGYSNKIYPGVQIEGVNLSNKTKDQAEKLLESKFQTAIGNKKVNIQVGDKTYSITYEKLDANFDINAKVEEAFEYGKNENHLTQYELIQKAAKKSYNLTFTYNEKPLDDLISNIDKATNISAVNGKITKNGSDFEITDDKDGYKVNDAQLKKDLAAGINSSIGADTTVKANIETVKAKVTKEKLQTINTLISTFSTNYGSISSASRVTNIQLATAAINGLCLMPGDTFSFNGTVGERTPQRGYQSAPVDIGDSVGLGYGGGICQVSSTMYNAVLLAGILPTVREHHSIPSIYVPLGQDATIDWGDLDYQFKNTLNYPIYIEGSSANGIETFNIYSNSSLTSKTYKVVNDVYAQLQPTTQYVDDPTMPAGQTEVEQSPSIGHQVKVYLETFQNGNMIAKDTVSNDTYDAINAIIKRGTKQ